MNAPWMRSFHQCWRVFSRRHAHEVFQSSLTSWSSKIIAVGIVDSSQRTERSPHDSQYRRVYSSKSAISTPGFSSVERRSRMNRAAPGEALAGLARAPKNKPDPGQGVGAVVPLAVAK